MAALTWDGTGTRLYETGISHGVLYVQSSTGTYPSGVAWNGLTGVTESPDGAEASDLYADDTKYVTLRSAETFGGTIEAYTYPDEFEECDGSASLVEGMTIGQQARKAFGLCYRTAIGSDTITDTTQAYKLHLVYGCTCSPSEKAYETINDSPEAITFSWEFETTPVAVTGFKPTSCVVIDSTKVDPDKLADLEKVLYGDTSTAASLPLPDAVKAILTTT